MNDDTRARPVRNAWWQACLLAAVVGGLVLITACGGGPSAPAPSASPGPAQQAVAFAQCVRHHGVPSFYISSPNSGAGSTSNGPALKLGPNAIVRGVDVSSPRYELAQKACQHLLPGAPPIAPTVAFLHGLVKAAACMRSHGYPDWPDPVIQNGLPFTAVPSGIDPNSPQFQAAQKICHPQM